jgi:hypothetical protein
MIGKPTKVRTHSIHADLLALLGESLSQELGALGVITQQV